MIPLRRLHRVAAVTVAFGVPSLAHSLDRPLDRSTWEDDVRAVLARRFEPEAPSRPELVRELVELGVERAPALLDVVLSGEEVGRTDAFPAAAGRADRDARILMIGTLRAWPRGEVLPHLVEYAQEADGTEDELRSRLAVVQVLGEMGGEALFEPILEIVQELEPTELRHGYVAGRLERALAAAFAGDVMAYGQLDARADQLDPALLACTARALARNARLADLDALLRLFGRDDELDEVCLGALASLEPRSAAPALGPAAQRLRGFLDHPDPKMQNLAVVALGRLHDVASFGRYLELLERGGAVSRGALWSLQRISGVQRGPDVELWRRWYDDEVRWMTDEAPAFALALTGEDTGLAVRAARELGSHRLFRDPLANMLAEGLEHPDPAVVSASCAALERVGGLSAALGMVDLLTHSDERVRSAARKALVGLTGDDLGPNAKRWRAVLSG